MPTPGRPRLLDSSVLIALLRGDPALTAHEDAIRQGALNTVVLGELLYGLEVAQQRRSNRERLLGLVSTLRLVPLDAETARCYARLKSRLHRQGTLIPDNDLWVAATAIQHRMVVVTRDKRHFPRVDEATIEFW